MNKHDIVRQLREQAAQEMPDVLSKINLQTAPIGVKSATPRRLFPVWRSFASAMIVLVFAVATAFVFLSQENTSVYALETDAETFGYQILSGAMFLQNEPTIDVDPLSVTLLDESTTLFEDNIDLFNETFAVLESLIGAKDDLVFDLIESDDPDFAQAITAEVTTLDNETYVYTIYLNQTLKKRMSSFEGEIRFESSSYTFRYVRMTGMELSRLTIENGMDTLVVSHQENADQTMSFRYQWFQSGESYRMVNLNLIKEDGGIVADLSTVAGQTPLSIRMTKTMVEGVPTLRTQYRFGPNGSVESGDVDVVAEYDEIEERVVYRMHGQVQINGQNQDVATEQPRPGKGNTPHGRW